METLMQFAVRVYASDDEMDVPEHLRDAWATYCDMVEIFHLAKMYAKDAAHTHTEDHTCTRIS